VEFLKIKEHIEKSRGKNKDPDSMKKSGNGTENYDRMCEKISMYVPE
jgi:hypothetical protein